MCWFSAEYADRVEEAQAGQRLAVKKMPWYSSWVISEAEFEESRPCPVCLPDRTRVLFRFAESRTATPNLSSEAEAVFRMLEHPRRDVFVFADGSQLALRDLQTGLVFDVLVVPGSEKLSAVLNPESNENEEDIKESESLFARWMTHF